MDSSHGYRYNELPPACTGGASEAALVQAGLNQDRKKNFLRLLWEMNRGFHESLGTLDRKNDEGYRQKGKGFDRTLLGREISGHGHRSSGFFRRGSGEHPGRL